MTKGRTPSDPSGVRTGEPLTPGFIHVPFNDIQALQAATTDRTCAVLLEPVQGEGGVHVADAAYMRAVRDWCDQKGLLLLLDEVQTGVGRTGALFAFQHYGIEPDVVTLGKGLGGGVPISAILVKEKAAVFGSGDHGTTFGGNPLTCSVALATVRWMLQQDLSHYAARMGDYFVERLKALKARWACIREVRGKGLLLAVEFEQELSLQVVGACLEHGLLVNPVSPNAIRFMPPLIVTEAEIEQAVEIVDRAIEQVTAPKRAGVLVAEP